MNKDCTVIINTCDAYSDLWDTFFTLFKIQWPDCPYPIVLCTESGEFFKEGLDIKCFKLFKKGESVTWSLKTKRILEQIDTEYIIMLLDDFFLESKVDNEKIQQCIKWMDENKNIATFSMMPAPQPNIISEKYKGFELRGPRSPFRLNCQAAVWRRKSLIKYLRAHEDAWHFETWGSVRSQRYKEEFYSLCEDQPHALDYNWGKPVIQGKWNKEEVSKLEEKFGITIDCSKRGFYEKGHTVSGNRPFIKKVINTIKSLI